MRALKGLVLALCVVLLCATLAPGAKADPWNKKTIVTFGDSVEIPGQVLQPGTYVFKLLDSPSNRHIVQIWTEDETFLITTILAVPAYRVNLWDEPMFTFDERPSDAPAPQALHTWFYPGDNFGQEFVYPYHGRYNRSSYSAGNYR